MQASHRKPAVVLAFGAGFFIVFTSSSYLMEVWRGIAIHTPRCAPITLSTVILVYAWTSAGILISAGGGVLSQRAGWSKAATAAFCLATANAICLSIWTFWRWCEMLLPYDDFCRKVGMG